jgi:hypothetical protein
MTPTEVVALLDKYIIGQADAKKAVAVALRNRWRRSQLPSPMKEEVVPKNILMIGPTGCGKTEIARRLAKLTDAPFIKVEATKFTEVGFYGRDVDQIIRDLVESSLILTRTKMRSKLVQEVRVRASDIHPSLALLACRTLHANACPLLLRQPAALAPHAHGTAIDQQPRACGVGLASPPSREESLFERRARCVGACA